MKSFPSEIYHPFVVGVEVSFKQYLNQAPVRPVKSSLFSGPSLFSVSVAMLPIWLPVHIIPLLGLLLQHQLYMDFHPKN